MPEKFFDGGLLPGGPLAIGIDQSLTGFAVTVLNVDRPECYETWVYKSPYSGVKRLNDIRFWLSEKLMGLAFGGHSFHDVAMEAAILASPTSLMLGELAGTVKLALWDLFEDSPNELCRTPLQIPPMTLKKYAAGKGNAKKQEMLLQIYKRWGIEFNDDNAADSYALARLASGNAEGAIESQIIEQIKDLKYRDTL
jgi:Holliday junction resolvasome RuvABC endonuclease subunit